MDALRRLVHSLKPDVSLQNLSYQSEPILNCRRVERVSAGGPYPVQADTDEENKDGNVKLETKDRWFNNPQYRLTVTKRTQMIISLMQEDENDSKRPYIPVNFTSLHVKSKRDRLWEVDKDDIFLKAAEGGQRFEHREITRTVWLKPNHDKKNVHYIIVLNTEIENKKE